MPFLHGHRSRLTVEDESATHAGGAYMARVWRRGFGVGSTYAYMEHLGNMGQLEKHLGNLG